MDLNYRKSESFFIFGRIEKGEKCLIEMDFIVSTVEILYFL